MVATKPFPLFRVLALTVAAWIATDPAQAQTAYYRGINLNGGDVVIGGKSFISMSAAKASGFVTGTVSLSSTALTPVPAVDASMRSLLNTAVYRPGAGSEMNLWQSGLRSQTYQVYLYLMENYQSNSRALNVWLEGSRVATEIGSLPKSEWRRYGPYSVALSDGTLNIKIKSVRGDPVLMGLEIVSGTISTSTPTPTPASVSSTAWKSHAFAAQAGVFTAEFDSVPSGAAIDAVTGLSLSPADAFSDTAVAIRFNPSGKIDVRNGGGYAATSSLAYAAGKSYHFRAVVDVPRKLYSVYVTPAGGLEQPLASNFAFRTEQSAVASLDHVGLVALSGSHTLSNFRIGGPSTNPSPSPSAPPPSPSPSASPKPSASPSPSGETPSDANILFYDNMETSAWTQNWGEQGCRPDSVLLSSVVPARKGGLSLRFDTRKSDFDQTCVTKERAEVKQLFDLGEIEYWYGISRYFPTDYVSDPNEDVVMQWHAGSPASPPISIWTENDEFHFNVIWDYYDNVSPYSGWEEKNLGRIEKGQWVDWVFHIRYSQGTDGFVEVYKNKVRVHRYAGPVGYKGTAIGDFKYGVYKWPWKDAAKRALSPESQRVNYADEVRVGNKNARMIDVMPR